MAAGDWETSKQEIANNSSLTIRPGSAGVVWMIKNINTGGAWELYYTDGTNAELIDYGSSNTVLDKRELIASRDYYYTVKNVSGGTTGLGYAALVVK